MHRSHTLRVARALIPIGVLTACGGEAGSPGSAASSDDLLAAASAMTTAGLAEHIRTLSSDEFGGRAPASPGGRLTERYLEEQFRAAGLQPGNGDSFFQEVPMVAITGRGNPTLRLSGAGGSAELTFLDDYVGWTTRVTEAASLDASELIFVGYGVVAPEYGWNDYEGLDVAGKTVVMLVNDPGFATQDEAVFNGNAMTYYGRWTYKFEEAARQGAAGALIVHETDPAGYPWEVITGSWTGPQFDLVRDDDNMGRVAVEGWLTLEAAEELFTLAGQDYGTMKERALRSNFRAVPLGITASVSIENDLQMSSANNVLGVLPGSDRADEYVVYMAHHDHLGTGSGDMEDAIYNGALDNATGTAGLLELVKAFQALPEPPSRSILFLAVTAEEAGLLGSAYYATYPVYPTNKTVAAINMDGLNIYGPMNDITVVGFGASELDDYLNRAALAVNRVLRPDPEPEKGFYYRSDHFSFAKVGVPALYLEGGIDHVEFGEEWTLERKDRYTAEDYHMPSDEFDESWDLDAAIDDLILLFQVGHDLASTDAWPEWSEGNEFRAIREADMAGGGTVAGTPAETVEPPLATGCFRSGSSRAEVRAVMGAPDTIDFGAWMYGRSNVTFGYGVVLNYSNRDGNLRLC